jgi:hypothetical protein
LETLQQQSSTTRLSTTASYYSPSMDFEKYNTIGAVDIT